MCYIFNLTQKCTIGQEILILLDNYDVTLTLMPFISLVRQGEGWRIASFSRRSFHGVFGKTLWQLENSFGDEKFLIYANIIVCLLLPWGFQ